MKQYQDMIVKILFFSLEDVIRTSFTQDDDQDNQTQMPEFPFK